LFPSLSSHSSARERHIVTLTTSVARGKQNKKTEEKKLCFSFDTIQIRRKENEMQNLSFKM
jgi:hypothetical protein